MTRAGLEDYGKAQPEDQDWRLQANCRDTDPDLFFPVGTTGAALTQTEMAKAVCRMCDVQIDCLNYALDTNQDSGIWGGTTEEERRKIRRTRRINRSNEQSA